MSLEKAHRLLNFADTGLYFLKGAMMDRSCSEAKISPACR
jgi:hypothetical protein